MSDLDDFKKHGTSVRKFVLRQFDGTFDKSLCGACAIASYTLGLRLKIAGHRDATFFCGTFGEVGPLEGAHCWVQVGQTVIDVTATQFNDELGINIPVVWVTSFQTYKQSITKYMGKILSYKEALHEVKDWDYQSPYHWRDTIDGYLSRFENRVMRNVRH